MATIDIKLKSYDELTFEITKLNTDLYFKNLEIQRLNNIIAELERHLHQEILEWQDDDNKWIKAQVQEDKVILDKLKELKEGKE